MPKRITILGATGSIGTSTLEIIRQNPEQYEIIGLTACENAEALAALVKEFSPRYAAIANDDKYADLKAALPTDCPTELLAGEDALCEIAALDCDWLMSAIVGVAGLRPTLAAIKAGHTIAFASKECLVSAGTLMLEACKQYGATLLPVDSEHNAIFQVFHFAQADQIERITLTASGGPFRGKSRDELRNITPAQAVAHPKWDMGAKISVDSATMMNKGLELIEAYHLFPVQADAIDMVVHPQSLIHGLVHYKDGSVLAQMGLPDMRTPIAYTLAYPDRLEVQMPRLNIAEIGALEFEPVNNDTFPAPALARHALASGQAACTVLNAANESAVAAFLDSKLSFLGITETVETVLNSRTWVEPTSIDDIYTLDREARCLAEASIQKKAA